MLSVSSAEQLRFLLYSLIVGASLSPVYDLMRFRRRFIFCKARLLTLVEDLVFCALCTLCYIIFIFAANLGIPRLYSALSAAVGFFLSHKLFGELFVKLYKTIFDFFLCVFKLLYRPLQIFLEVFHKIASAILCKVTIYCKNMKNLFIFHKNCYIIKMNISTGRYFEE